MVFLLYSEGMKEIDYKTKGICASRIKVQLDDDDVIQNIEFFGGCDGNHKGIVALCKGMKAEEAVKRLKGIKCGYKNSSCPDQLALALETR